MLSPTPEDIEQMKPRKGALLLLIPVFMVFAVLVLYIVTWIIVAQGRSATGERVQITWRACADAQPVIHARVTAMGLGDPVFSATSDGFRLQVTLPADPLVAASVPSTLSEIGKLEAVSDGVVLFDNSAILNGSIRQDLTLIPWTVLRINDAAVERLGEAVLANRDGEVVYRLDGVQIGRVSNLKGYGPEIEFTSEDASTDLERMQKTAARTIVIGSGPLPCAVERL